ncbi:MAG TPA: hypothetical protein VFK54_12940 [Candidatus Limnocylindrales bacterium]|nr:hypothetical protein [Candidatus Limnocylindrales bacterium]
MSDASAEEDLRATIDSVGDDAQKLAAIEEEKGRLDPTDPRMTELSSQAKELAARLERGVVAEDRIARDLQREPPPRLQH